MGMAVALAPDPVTDAEVSVEDRLRAVCGHLNVLHAELVELAAEALETGCWNGWGVRSLAHWLMWKAGLSPAHAAEIARLAEARQTHPKVMATFGDGALSLDQVTVATKAPAYLDADFAQLAEVCTVPQLRLAVRAARPAPATPPPVDDRGNGSSELVQGWFDDDGRYRLRADLDPDRGRIVDAALAEARDSLFHTGHTDVTWADALVEVAQRSLAGMTAERQERFRVNWFLDPTRPVPATWVDGIAIPDWLREHLLCDGTISPTFTAAGRPVSVGRTVQDVPERTRRLILARDRKCRIPWCSQSRWLQIHHLHHQAHGGGHDTNKLIAICGSCHRAHHHHGHFNISGDADQPDGLVFTDAHGDVIDPAARPIKPTGPPPTPTRPYEHPIGGRLHKRELIFRHPPVP
jgi:hypothetical protein